MNSSSPRYADWKAPGEDGQLLIWPGVGDIIRQTRENQQRLSFAQTLIQNVPLGELRRRQRELIGHTADERPLIASGHQTELYHPGVWVKDVLAGAIAGRVEGESIHFAVDTDAPRHLHLRWPGGSLPVTQDARLNSAPWSALLDAPTSAQAEMLRGGLRAARREWDFQPVCETFLSGLKSQSNGKPGLSAALTQAVRQLDQELGLRHRSLLMSPVWESEPYLVFVHHLLARAGEFAGQYNSALAGYRAEQRITSPGRPMPDLRVGADEVEAPFWLDDLAGETRQRLFLRRTAEGWGMLLSEPTGRAPQAERLKESGEVVFVFDESAPGFEAASKLLACLAERRLRIAPRALTLTLFFRLFLADQFVHGIGGGRYDQVTDRLIASYFGIEPPSFSVTTATLYFPAANGAKRINLRPLLQEGRRMRHGAFSKEKRAMADRITALPRRSAQRRELFFQMHAWIAQQAKSPQIHEWTQRLEEAMNQQTRQKAIFDRELFFAIQPESRLREMISRYDAQFK